MPHIIPTLAARDEEAIGIFADYKLEIQRSFAKTYGYKTEQVAIIPRLLTDREVWLAVNLLRLELVIDTGDRHSRFTDGDAVAFKDVLCERCPNMARHLNFRIWLKEPRSNGFAEHRPAPDAVVLRNRSIRDMGGPA